MRGIKRGNEGERRGGEGEWERGREREWLNSHSLLDELAPRRVTSGHFIYTRPAQHRSCSPLQFIAFSRDTVKFFTHIRPGLVDWDLEKGTTFPYKTIFVPQTPFLLQNFVNFGRQRYPLCVLKIFSKPSCFKNSRATGVSWLNMFWEKSFCWKLIAGIPGMRKLLDLPWQPLQIPSALTPIVLVELTLCFSKIRIKLA